MNEPPEFNPTPILPIALIGVIDRVPNAVKVLGQAFEDDPGVRYMLNNLSAEKRLAYLPSFFDVLFKLAGRNHATFEEVDDWSCCALFVPPGYSVDDLFTLPPWGMVGMVNTLGIRGMMVSGYISFRLLPLSPHTHCASSTRSMALRECYSLSNSI